MGEHDEMPVTETSEATPEAERATLPPFAARVTERGRGRAAPAAAQSELVGPEEGQNAVTPFAALADKLASKPARRNRTLVISFTGPNGDPVEYTVNMRRSRDAETWRSKMGAPIREIAFMLNGWKDMRVDSLADIGGLIERVNMLLLGSIEHVTDLIFEYDPELGQKRDEIMLHCWDDELVEAFMAIVRASYPFGAILRSLPGLGSATTSRS